MRHFSFTYLICFFCFALNAQISDFNYIDFKRADAIAQRHHKSNLNDLPKLAYKLTTSLSTDVEKFRAIYYWVCHNIANDYALYLKHQRKRQQFKNDSIKLTAWQAKFRKQLFKTLRKKKRTICTGYAYLVKALADLADIECEIIHGFGRVSTTNIESFDIPNHSWNAVKLNGKWYLCDPTWASGIPNIETKNFSFDYNDGFFLANPELFAINHFPNDKKWWLIDEENIPTFTDFKAAPVIYGKAYSKLKAIHHPHKMHHIIKRNTSLNFEFEIKAPILKKDINLLLDSGYNTWRIQPDMVKLENLEVKLKHQFKNKGFYDVHLYIEKDLIATYTVKVIDN